MKIRITNYLPSRHEAISKAEDGKQHSRVPDKSDHVRLTDGKAVQKIFTCGIIRLAIVKR